MPELETAPDGSVDDLDGLMQGDDRLYPRFGYESGQEGGGSDDDATPAGLDAGDYTIQSQAGMSRAGHPNSDQRSSRPAPWISFVDGLKRRVDQGVGVQQIVFEPYSDYISDEAMFRLKADIAAVVPEIIEI